MERSLKRRARTNDRLRQFLTQPNQPGYQIIRHPAFLNKPITCQSGLHKDLQFKRINGILSYYCPHCGMSIAQGIHDRTWSKNDIRRVKRIRQEANKPRTKEETLRQSWEIMELLRKKYSQEEIDRMFRKRMMEKYGVK